MEAWDARRGIGHSTAQSRNLSGSIYITAPSDFPFLDSPSLLTESGPPPRCKTHYSHTLASTTKKKQLPNPNRWSPFVIITISSSPYYTRAPTYYSHSHNTPFLPSFSLSYISKPNQTQPRKNAQRSIAHTNTWKGISSREDAVLVVVLKGTHSARQCLLTSVSGHEPEPH